MAPLLIALSVTRLVSCQAQAPDAQTIRRMTTAALAGGDFARAAGLYNMLLDVSRTGADSAMALFGRGFAIQQLTSAPSQEAGAASSLHDDTLTLLVDSYRLAQRLDSARYFAAGQYNMGRALSAAGRHASAATELAKGGLTSDSLRGALLLAAAREYDLAGRTTDAIATLRQVSRDSTVGRDAQARLVDIYVRQRSVQNIVALADSARPDASAVQSLNTALLGFMRDPAWAQWRERCLLPLARNYATMDLGPLYFQGTPRSELDAARRAAAGTPVAAGIDALIDAYRVRDSSARYVAPASASWWLGDVDRHKVWSTTIRSLGDWYLRSDQPVTAMSFYEAALGTNLGMGEEWIDLAALPPLASLYATLPADQAKDKAARLTQFEERAFQGKARALAKNDLLRIRMFRLTLGTLFAREGRWEGAYRGATLQLELMRRHSRDLRDLGIKVSDPPDILELLMAEYQRRGCTAKAADVAHDVRDEYQRRGQSAEANRVAQALAAMQAEGLKSCTFDGSDAGQGGAAGTAS
jgi:tetratricopeptide (TPR) repeat protein